MTQAVTLKVRCNVIIRVLKYLGCHRWRYSIDSCICLGCEKRCCWRNPRTESNSSSRICTKRATSQAQGSPAHRLLIFVSTHLSVTACINSSISSSYSFPLILLCFSPMYRGSLSSVWIKNNTTDEFCYSCMNHESDYKVISLVLLTLLIWTLLNDDW